MSTFVLENEFQSFIEDSADSSAFQLPNGTTVRLPCAPPNFGGSTPSRLAVCRDTTSLRTCGFTKTHCVSPCVCRHMAEFRISTQSRSRYFRVKHQRLFPTKIESSLDLLAGRSVLRMRLSGSLAIQKCSVSEETIVRFVPETPRIDQNSLQYF